MKLTKTNLMKLIKEELADEQRIVNDKVYLVFEKWTDSDAPVGIFSSQEKAEKYIAEDLKTTQWSMHQRDEKYRDAHLKTRSGKYPSADEYKIETWSLDYY